MDQNKNCYEYKEIIFSDGLFNNSIDATYIIHLKDNGRYDEITNQLSKYHPTNIVYVVINQGYKKCEKKLPVKDSAYDLVDAFLQIFKHSLSKNYNNILILEDDFIFSEKVNELTIRKDIDDHLNSKRNQKFVYYLGCIPYIQSIGYSNHNTLYLSGGTHACVYSKNMREHVLQNHNQDNIVDWDVFNNMNIFQYNRYVYYQPLCYQLFPETENSKSWFNPFGFADVIKYILRFFLLNKQVEPGYSYFYMISKFIFILFILMSIISNAYMLSWNVFQLRKKWRKYR